MSLKKVIPILVLGLIMTVSFQNCSKAGIEVGDFKAVAPTSGESAQASSASAVEDNVSDNSSNNTTDTSVNTNSSITSGVTSDGASGSTLGQTNTDQSVPVVVSPAPESSIPAVDSLIKSCDDMKARGKTSIQTSQVTFEDPAKACQWGMNGNLSVKDKYVRGRIEQYKQLSIPSGSTVCHVKLVNIDEQNFRYDDNIILTLNNYILASTTNFSQHFSQTNGFYKYDWSKLVDKAAQNTQADTVISKQYCVGASSGLSQCLFPATQTLGRVQLEFNERIIENILGMTSASSLNLGMITTGDNDSTDCQHVPLRFAIEVEYF